MLANCWCSVLPVPSIICFIQFIAFPAVFLAHLHLILVPPCHSSFMPTPFPGLCSAVSGVSPSDSGILGISPPLPRGCAPALSGPAMAVQPYLAQPYLCVSGCHAWDRSCNLWPCCPPGTGLRVGPVLGVAAAGRAPSTAIVPKELHPQGSRGQEELFWAFLNAQDGRIATVR